MEKSNLTQKIFYRVPEKGVISGICAGLSDSFGVNANFIRIVMVALVFSGFVPVLFVYLGFCFILPRKSNLAEDMDQSIMGTSRNHGPPARAPSVMYSKSKVKWNLDRASNRLNRLESYLVSDRYQLDHQYKKLEME